MKNLSTAASSFALALVALLALPSSALAIPFSIETDSLSAADFIRLFHESVATGDSLAVASSLAEDVTIAEGGNLQTRSEYLSHHFRGDARFLGSLTREGIALSTRVDGKIAVVVSTSRLSGSFNERAIDMTSIETAVLQRSNDTWEIVSIHWSSGKR